MVHVWTGNNESRIFKRDSILSFGSRDPDAEPLEGVEEFEGTFDDLWWTTVIDVRRMVEILTTPERPKAEAAAVVEAYMANQPWGVSRLNLPRGTYHVYYAADLEAFEANVDKSRLPIQYPAIETSFVLSPRPLNLENNQAVIEVPDMQAKTVEAPKARHRLR